MRSRYLFVILTLLVAVQAKGFSSSLYCNFDGACNGDETVDNCYADCYVPRAPSTIPSMLSFPVEPATYPSSIKPGNEGVIVQVTLYNSWNLPYYNITSDLWTTDPFIPLRTHNIVERLNPQETINIFYTLSVDGSAFPGDYKLTHTMTFYDKDGNEGFIRNRLNIRVLVSQRLEIVNVTVSPPELLPGQVADVTATFRNTGMVVIDDIQVSYSAISSNASSNVEAATPTKVRIGHIEPGKEAQAAFKIRATTIASSSVYSATLKADYSGGTVEDAFSISLSGAPSLDISAPGLSNPLEPGKRSVIEVELTNKGGSALSGVRASLSPTTSDIAVVSDAELYLDSIRAAETKRLSYDVEVPRTTKSGIYYADLKIDAIKSQSQRLSFEIKGAPALSLAGVQVDKDTVLTGQPFSLSVQLENIGTADAKSVKATIDNDKDLGGVKTSFVGTVDIDDTGTAIFDLRDEKAGQRRIPITITYDDEFGRSYSKTLTAEYFITMRPTDFITPIIVLVILAAGYYVYRKRRERAEKIKALVKKG